MYLIHGLESWYNHIMWLIGYQRIYDIDSNRELTPLYCLIKIMDFFGMRGYEKNDKVRNKIGIYKMMKYGCERYIMYDKKVSSINYNLKTIRMRYQDIVKIEYEKNGEMIDITEAKNRYHCIERDRDRDKETENEMLHDMIKFHLLILGVKDPVNANIMRKKFDDELLKHTITTNSISVI